MKSAFCSLITAFEVMRQSVKSSTHLCAYSNVFTYFGCNIKSPIWVQGGDPLPHPNGYEPIKHCFNSILTVIVDVRILIRVKLK